MQPTGSHRVHCARAGVAVALVAMMLAVAPMRAHAAKGDQAKGDQDLIGDIVGQGGLFDFTKLDRDANPLANQKAVYTVTPWACVHDNITGLTWETKTTDGGLRDESNTYTWYNPNAQQNAGSPGKADGGDCKGSDCDTHAYVQAVNNRGLCGHDDWRMPTRAELRTIVDYRTRYPAIDQTYFPNTAARAYWTSEPNKTYPNFAWHTDFKFGLASYYYFKSGAASVRLVRGHKGAN